MIKGFLESLFEKITAYNAVVSDFEEASEKAADPAAAYVNWGIKLAQEGDIETALIKFEKAAELDPNRAECMANWGITLIKAGQLDNAIEKFNQAVHLDPADIYNYSLLGAALVEKGEMDQANATYEVALKISPQNYKLYRSWGVALARQNNYDAAIDKFKNSLAIRRYQPEVFFMWGAILAEQERFEDAIDKFRVTLRYLPKHEEALYFWCLCLNQMGDYAHAITTARQCIELMPENPDVYVQLGHALAHTGQVDEAIANYRHALMLNEHNAEAYESWGMMLVQQEKYDDAYIRFEKALALDPNRLSVHAPWGQALVHQQRFDEAIEHLRIAHEVKPDDVNVLVHWATVAMRQGDAHELVGKLFDVEAQNPWHPQIHYLLGIHHLGDGQYQKAIDMLSKVIEESPDFLDAGIHLSLAYCGMGNTEDAVRSMRPFVRQHADSAKVQFFYGHTLYQHGDFSQARDKFKKAIELNPHYAEPKLGLAEMALLEGDWVDCRHWLNQLLSEATNNNAISQQTVHYLDIMLQLNELKSDPPPSDDAAQSLLEQIESLTPPENPVDKSLLMGYAHALFHQPDAHQNALREAMNILEASSPEPAYRDRVAAFWHACWDAFHLAEPPAHLNEPVAPPEQDVLWTLFKS